ncbi:ATP-grasp domain-containing protein [Paraburkholderia aromaticivorans]|uniref:ATP-binding protein n=1 Tax=Paraburkholderia aromaticivorans TaxID=2026199 RepID=A0A248VU23_9BURK|nr:ATP-grasp domain-containing protein [Paraburkholderia aromaticivorans]ASW02528.1 ATP-binding protein [Paraburkholderia aromaticivorans]
MTSRPLLPHAPFVAVAGLSARMLAQSAARAGLRVAALDIFGDRDTREASELWFDIGGGPLSIDGLQLAAALERIARLPGLIGWIDGSGLEPFVAQLCGMPGLPRFIGNPVEASAAVREPRRFFALLDALDIPHPPVAFAPPATPQGWLVKRADGCGGTHIEPATARGDPRVPAQAYFQRRRNGRSLSALFIAARGRSRVVGFAEQLTCEMGNLPFVHAGSIGPIDLPPIVTQRVSAAIAALCARTGLTGLNSCDFLLDGDAFDLLEINTRPSSTMTLYETASPHAWPRGLLACHIEACRYGRLPAAPTSAAAPWRAGQQVLFAPHPFAVSQSFSDACLHDPRCRDVPMPGVRIEAGDPVCTLLVRAASVDAVRPALDAQRALVVQRIETCHETDHALIPCHT